MIQTTSSHTQQQPEQTDLSPQSEQHILNTVACTICDAAYAPSPTHQGLLEAPPKVLEAAFMSMCHFCFRCRRPACPSCWDVIHGVCGACVQEANLPFRADAAPLNGTVFPPLRRSETAQEKTSSPLLVCIRLGRFQPNNAHSIDPQTEAAAAPTQVQLEAETGKRSRPVAQASMVTPTLPEKDDDVQEESAAGVPFIKIVERFVTAIILIILLAIAAMIILAEASATANAQIVHFLHIDIRFEIGYLISLVRQIHF